MSCTDCFKRVVNIFFVLLLLIAFVSCGGKGGSTNTAPNAQQDSFTVLEGGLQDKLDGDVSSVLENDSDPENNPLTAILKTPPTHAALNGFTLNQDGSFSYEHDGSETISDSFTYAAYDGKLQSNVATVSITVTPQNDPPVAVPDAAGVVEDQQLSATGNVLDNDSDAEGDKEVANPGVYPGTFGSLDIAVNGVFTYTLNNSLPEVDVLNDGDTITDNFTYVLTDGELQDTNGSLVVTITGTTDVVSDVRGAWKVSVTITGDDPVGCAGQPTGQIYNALSIKQNGNNLQVFVADGTELSGNIYSDDSFTLTGGRTIEAAKLNDPTSTELDVWTDNVTVNGNFTNGTFSAVARVESTRRPNCAILQDVNGDFLYQYTGTENYNRLYGFEWYSSYFEATQGYSIISDDETMNLPIEFDFSVVPPQIYMHKMEGLTVNISDFSWDPDSGYFTFSMVREYKANQDDNPLTIEYSVKENSKVSGLFLNNPDLMPGINGSPLVLMQFMTYAHEYNGDFSLGILPHTARNEDNSSYGKLINGSPFTRAVHRVDQTPNDQVYIGYRHPNLKRVHENSVLYFEVLRNGIQLCATVFSRAGDVAGGYRQQVLYPPIYDEINYPFQDLGYSRVGCYIIDALSVTDILHLRIVDDGGNIIIGDDNDVVYDLTTNYSPMLVSAAERLNDSILAVDITVNEMKVSQTRVGKIVPLFGYYDLYNTLNVSWPKHPSPLVDTYQIRWNGRIPEDYLEFRQIEPAPATGEIVQASLPGGSMSDHETLGIVAVNHTGTANTVAMAIGTQMVVPDGIQGLFNVELGPLVPLESRVFQVNIDGNDKELSCAITRTTTIMPGTAGEKTLSCTPGFVNFYTDQVSINVHDKTLVLPDFELVFNFSGFNGGFANLHSNSPVNIANGTAMAVNPELHVRTLHFGNSNMESLVTLVNPVRLSDYDQADLTLNLGGNFIIDGADSLVNSLTFWQAGDATSSFLVIPTDDGFPQNNGRFISRRSVAHWGLPNGLFAQDDYRLTFTSNTVGVQPLVYRAQNIDVVDPYLLVPPVRTQISIDGNVCGVAQATGVSCDAGNPITVQTAGPVINVQWTVAQAPPLGARWRLVFRDGNDSSILPVIRTNRILPNELGADITSVLNPDNSVTYTWTNPGEININKLTRIQIRVDDGTLNYDYVNTARMQGSQDVYITP